MELETFHITVFYCMTAMGIMVVNEPEDQRGAGWVCPIQATLTPPCRNNKEADTESHTCTAHVGETFEIHVLCLFFASWDYLLNQRDICQIVVANCIWLNCIIFLAFHLFRGLYIFETRFHQLKSIWVVVCTVCLQIYGGKSANKVPFLFNLSCIVIAGNSHIQPCCHESHSFSAVRGPGLCFSFIAS